MAVSKIITAIALATASLGATAAVSQPGWGPGWHRWGYRYGPPRAWGGPRWYGARGPHYGYYGYRGGYYRNCGWRWGPRGRVRVWRCY